MEQSACPSITSIQRCKTKHQGETKEIKFISFLEVSSSDLKLFISSSEKCSFPLGKIILNVVP